MFHFKGIKLMMLVACNVLLRLKESNYSSMCWHMHVYRCIYIHGKGHWLKEMCRGAINVLILVIWLQLIRRGSNHWTWCNTLSYAIITYNGNFCIETWTKHYVMLCKCVYHKCIVIHRLATAMQYCLSHATITWVCRPTCI